MKVLVLAGDVVLVAATLAAAAGPGVTCAGARPRSIEALICGSPLLAALDVEMARLYRLATGPREPVVAIGAKQAQRDWLLERNRCLIYEGADERAFWEHQGEATYRGGATAPEVRCVPEAIGSP